STRSPSVTMTPQLVCFAAAIALHPAAAATFGRTADARPAVKAVAAVIVCATRRRGAAGGKNGEQKRWRKIPSPLRTQWLAHSATSVAPRRKISPRRKDRYG